MPFLSKSQRRKFYALKSEGKMTQNKIDEWEQDTPKTIPERVEKMAGFYTGFEKKAEQIGFTKEEAQKFKKLKLRDRRKWLNPPPDFTEGMSPRKFKRWAAGTEEGRGYAKMDMGE